MNGEPQSGGRKVSIDSPILWRLARERDNSFSSSFFLKLTYCTYGTPEFGYSLLSGIIFVLLFLLVPLHSIST